MRRKSRKAEESKIGPKAKEGGGGRGDSTRKCGLLTPEWANPVDSVWWLRKRRLLAVDKDLVCVTLYISLPAFMPPHGRPPCGCVHVPLPTERWPQCGSSLKVILSGNTGILVIFMGYFKTSGPPNFPSNTLPSSQGDWINTGLTDLACQVVL